MTGPSILTAAVVMLRTRADPLNPGMLAQCAR